MAILSGVSWCVVDILSNHQYPFEVFRYANSLICFLAFVIIGLLSQALQQQADDHKGQETDQAVRIVEHLEGVLMVRKYIHHTPAHPAENSHADDRQPSQVSAPQRNRNEEEDEEQEVVAGEIHDVAQHQQVGHACQNDLQLKGLAHVIRCHAIPSNTN